MYIVRDDLIKLCLKRVNDKVEIDPWQNKHLDTELYIFSVIFFLVGVSVEFGPIGSGPK